MMFYLFFGVFFVIITYKTSLCQEETPLWRWSCERNSCVKYFLKKEKMKTAISLETCKILCDKYGNLWPKPTGEVVTGNLLSNINLNGITINIVNSGKSDVLINAAFDRFKNIVSYNLPKDNVTDGLFPNKGKSLILHLVSEEPHLMDISLDLNEKYYLRVTSNYTHVNATIVAENFFGLRHGMETLSQFLFYDNIQRRLFILSNVIVSDGPMFAYRGVMLDTARNYFSVDSILRNIDAMAAVKLNTFHWHITDTQSFPFVSKRRPLMSKYGAYSSEKVYTKEDIAYVVEYARVRGIRVLPELDAPAHVGEGWHHQNLTVCFKINLWWKYCQEPPCGQLNPANPDVYEVLQDVYTDMAEDFNSDMFHMGGDEVMSQCWFSSREIKNFMKKRMLNINKLGFLSLWSSFLSEAQRRLYKAFGKKIPIILWDSTLTDYKIINKYLNKDDYIIQMWGKPNTQQVKGLLDKGYRVIMSRYDTLLLNRGFGARYEAGKYNKMSYISWEKVYENNDIFITHQNEQNMLGGEAALWSEQCDSSTLDHRLWPRAAALAERLWSNPTSKWSDAVLRILHMRERLIKMGLQPAPIQPEWCYRNENGCNP